MNTTRRNAISVTAAGLLHVAKDPAALASEPQSADFVLREAKERGQTDLGWLSSYHSFSFGNYYDQRHMGFRSLRVINDDRIAPGRGFPTHPHRDMEIISYVLDGALQHRDSTGKGAIITPEDIQMMSAGRGITHSEYNPNQEQANHFLQIWIQPAVRGAQPRYSDNKVGLDDKTNQWRLIAGPEGSTAAVDLRQDASIYATRLQAGQSTDFTVQRGRHAWLQVARGVLEVNGSKLVAGDAIATSKATELHAKALEETDALLFDLA